MRRKGVRAACVLALAVLICLAMNMAAMLVDTPKMRRNAAQGAQMLCEQGATPQLVGGFLSAQPDNFTSVLMVKIAAYTGEEPFLVRAFGGLRVELSAQEDQTAWEAFCTYADGSASPSGGLNYARYWHGYTFPLRLLLCVLDLANIQMLLLFVQLALLCAVVLLMNRRGLGELIPAFFLAYFLMMPSVLGTCLQYMPVSLLALLACTALLALEERIEAFTGMPAFFALIGLLTSYMDLLTFPLVALLYPLVLLLALRLKGGAAGYRLLGEAVACCAAWGAGYAGMWALKWGIVSIVYHSDFIFSGVLGQARIRLSADSDGQAISRLDALRVNLNVIVSKASYLLLLAGMALLSLLCGLRRAVLRRSRRPDRRAAVLLLPLAVSLAWYFVMANHAYQHLYFTYRNLTGGIFSAYALAVFLPGGMRDGEQPPAR